MACWDQVKSLFSQRWTLFIGVAVYSVGLLNIASHSELLSERFIPQHTQNPHRSPTPSKGDITSAVTHLLPSPLLPVDAENFTGSAGQIYSLPFYDSPDQIRFTSPLGGELLILDVDNRALDGPGGILNSTWETNIDNMGRLNHYIYARTHGYDYKLMQVPNTPDRHGTWSKVRALSEALNRYEFVVVVDADAMFPYPHVPMEWLFNYWNLTAETLVALAEDPDESINEDDYGRLFLNTGFIIAQQSPRTLELVDAWDSCSSGVRFPGCKHFRQKWPHEQGAFGNYIRYEFDRPDDVKVLPCGEANGCPQTKSSGCVGKLVRHYWGAKPQLPAAVQESWMRYLLPHLHQLFIQEQDSVIAKLNGSRAHWEDHLAG